jgi:hypothetical protein
MACLDKYHKVTAVNGNDIVKFKNDNYLAVICSASQAI